MQDPASSPDGRRSGIVGASGFTGAELLRLCARPPRPRRAGRHRRHAGRHAGPRTSTRAWRRPTPTSPSRPTTRPPWPGSTSCSSACPTAPARRSCPSCSGKVGHLVDLAADFRLQDPALYPQWYGEAHTAPELLPDFAYGLPELFRDEIQGADHVATPGCYPTAAVAGAGARSCAAGVVETDGIIVDAASGVSGRRPAARSRPPRSAPSTRTSPPTGCSTTATRPRWSRCSARRCSSRPTSRR